MTNTASNQIALLAADQPAASGSRPSIPDYMTVEEIAAKIKSSKAFIYKLIDSGDLECDRFGTLVRVTPEQFDRYRNRPKQSPQAA
jgi:excisionase family DNA binding protein